MRTLSIAAMMLAATATRAEEWVTVKGQIVYAGPAVPERPALKVDKDQDKCLVKGPILSEEWVVNKETKGVKNVFVWLAADGTAKLPVHPSLAAIKVRDLEVDQPCCAFEPHVLAVREGQKLVVKNSSAIAHNVLWAGNQLKNPGGNPIVPAGKSHVIDTLKADRFPVSLSCNIHPWMRGWVRVYDHPYYAVTDDNGNFEIKLAPAGSWKFFAWHEGAGWRDKATGKNGEPVTLSGATLDRGKLEIKPAS